MMDKNIKTKGLSFVEKLEDKDMSKEELFRQLHETVGKDCDIAALRLPSASAVAFLESSKAKRQIKSFEPRIADALKKLQKAEKSSQKRNILDALKFMTAGPRDYAVIALDKYYKMDKSHTLDSFCSEYKNYAQSQKDNSKMIDPVVMSKMQNNSVSVVAQ